MGKKYNEQIDCEPAMASEPAVAYATATARRKAYPAEEYCSTAVEDLPSEYIRMALECALDDERKGKLIPNDMVMEELHKRLR